MDQDCKLKLTISLTVCTVAGSVLHEYMVAARISSKQMPEATQELIMAFIM